MKDKYVTITALCKVLGTFLDYLEHCGCALHIALQVFKYSSGIERAQTEFIFIESLWSEISKDLLLLCCQAEKFSELNLQFKKKCFWDLGIGNTHILPISTRLMLLSFSP